MSAAPHIPVLLDAVVEAMACADGETVLDGTFGAGGYTKALLASADIRVIGVDRDPRAVVFGRALEADEPRFSFREGRFSELDELAGGTLDGVVLDIGVSSMQIDEAERGFSFMRDGPLDMRMSQSGESAADLVNGTPEADLADLIYAYGEERRSRRIARAIVERRREAPFERTLDLAEIVSKAYGPRPPEHHPATRTFQALRIAVNDELGELQDGLAAAERALRPGGRLVVVTFHSLEDRIVKSFMAERAGRVASGSRFGPPQRNGPEPSLELIGRKPVTASRAEASANPRARSAKLRAARRLDAPAHMTASGQATPSEPITPTRSPERLRST